MSFISRFFFGLCFWGMFAAFSFGYPRTEAQETRLTRFIPRTLEKLERQLAVHVAVVGDEIASMETLDENNGNVLLSMEGHLLMGMEREFFYSGGVRWVNPPEGYAQKLREHRGNEITMESYAEPGTTSLHLLQKLTTRVFLNQPDLVLLQVGLNDFRRGVLVDTYKQGLREAVRYCRAQGAEVIL
ncbi:MAG: SGNH/GDSL hydrolase family protein, partial [Verrucomicrobiota bacterium]